jgi:hypothetical protein
VAALLWLPTCRTARTPWLLLLGGFIAGWMVAGKATMGLALPLLLYLLIPADENRSNKWQTLGLPVSLVGAGLILGSSLGVPYGIIHPQKYLYGLAQLQFQYSGYVSPESSVQMENTYRPTFLYMIGTLGWGFWTLTALGLVPLVKSAGWLRTVIMLTPLAAALITFGSHAFFSERSFSPFLPIAVLLFGAGGQFLIEAIITPQMSLWKHRATIFAALLCITLALPGYYSWQIVIQGFSGREKQLKDEALAGMKGNLTGKKLVVFSGFFHAQNFKEIAATIESHEPMLIVLADYYDTYTPKALTTLQVTFHGRILGVRESIFPGLPTCSLHYYFSPRLWLLYIPAK